MPKDTGAFFTVDIKKLAQQALKAVLYGQLDKAKTLLIQHPACLIQRVEVTDHTGRKIVATPFQGALGAIDKPMWDMMMPLFEKVPEIMVQAKQEEVAIAIEAQKEMLIQFNQQFPQGIDEARHITRHLSAIDKDVFYELWYLMKDDRYRNMIDSCTIPRENKHSQGHPYLSECNSLLDYIDDFRSIVVEIASTKSFMRFRRLLNEFRDGCQHQLNPQTITHGKHYSLINELAALMAYCSEQVLLNETDKYHDIAFEVIGYIQRLMPANYLLDLTHFTSPNTDEKMPLEDYLNIVTGKTFDREKGDFISQYGKGFDYLFHVSNDINAEFNLYSYDQSMRYYSETLLALIIEKNASLVELYDQLNSGFEDKLLLEDDTSERCRIR